MAIPPVAQAAVVKYLESALSLYSTSFNIRNQLLARDKEYLRENDSTETQRRAKSANQAGDSQKLQNVTVPVVMPQVESALAELHETFLTGYPIFGTVAPPGQEDAMEQMDTIVADNSTRGGWPVELLQTLRDGLKYDLGAIEVVWENRKIFTIETPQEKNLTEGTPKETYYAGNFMKHLDMYNTFLDTRVSPEKNHLSGEYAGYTEMISRIETKKRMEDLDPLGSMNFRAAFESPSGELAASSDITGSYYIPQLNPDALLQVEERAEHNWLKWVGEPNAGENGIKYQNSYEWTVLYARILPSDFKIASRNRNHVQIWKFIVINRNVVIFAERQTNAHNYLPIIVCKPSADGLSWQSKSFAENATPFQQVATGLVNSGIESQRRKVYDRMFYDPTRINKADIEKVSSVARIPVKNNMYGKQLSDAVYIAPYRDEGVAEVMSMSQQFVSMGEVVNGQNRVQQGQFQKGNKTRKEFETTMGNASNRGRMRATGLEFTFFVPIKEIIKSNILQFQPPTTLMNQQTGNSVEIDPAKLRQAFIQFKMSDGYTPADKMVSGETVGMLFNAAAAIPTIPAEYDLMGILTYSMQLQGGGWIRQFKRTPEQQKEQLALMQQSSQASGQANPPPAKPADTGAPA